MSKKIHDAAGHTDGSYTVKNSKKSNILAFILCLLIAFVIWAYTMSYGEGAKTDEIGGDEQVSETV